MVKSTLKNIRTYSTLFDNVVKPIVLSCEFWGKRVKLEENIEKIMNTVWEKLHTKVCKNILGVHRKASNITNLQRSGGIQCT